VSGEFRKAFKGVDAAIKQGTARALNRALSSTKTKMVRTLREQTGLKTDVITARTRSLSATSSKLSVIFAIATKFGIALSKFAPSLKKVRVKQRNGRTVLHYGVSAKIGQQARQLIPGAFFLVGKTGEAVLGRKSAYDKDGSYSNPTAPKYKTAQLRTRIFSEVAEQHQAEAQQYLADTFDKNVAHEIEYAIQKKFDENK
jgi:hypothetical protein